MATDGTVATGAVDDFVKTYRPGPTWPSLHQYAVNDLQRDGLAWAPDENRLFAPDHHRPAVGSGALPGRDGGGDPHGRGTPDRHAGRLFPISTSTGEFTLYKGDGQHMSATTQTTVTITK